MKKQDYYNTVGLQIEGLRELVGVQTEKCFDRAKLFALMDESTFRNLNRVIITGCGDSYSAAGAMLPAFKKFSGLRLVSVPDPMEFCRFYSQQDTAKGCANSETLVIAVSASGGSDRIVEIMDKAKRLDVGAMLISNNPESKGAKAANIIYHVETPPGCNSPGLRSYFASMIAIVALGAYIGLVKGHISSERFDNIKQSIVDHTMAFMTCYERIDDQMFQLAQTWKNYEKFEAVGDWDEGFSAQFVEEKFIECAGVHCTHADTEDWCHINYFMRDPQRIGTIFMLNSRAADFDRALYTVGSALAIGRPTLVITDADASAFPKEAVVCTIPPAEETWLAPIVDFAPGSMLGAYVAAVADKMFFCGRYDFRTQTWNM
ncbi:MAG: SIS domain-containing protein [Christensenellales bacterium]